MWSKWLKKCENNWNTHIWFIFQPPPLSFSLSLSLSLYLSLSHHTHTRTLKNMHAHINALPRAHTHTHTHTHAHFLSFSLTLSQSSTATFQLQTMLLERHKLGHKVMIPKIHVFWKMMSRALAAKRMRPAENISLHLIVNLTLVSWRWDTRWKKTLWRKKFEALGQKTKETTATRKFVLHWLDFSTQGRTISRFGVQLCASKHFLDGRIFDPLEHLSLKIPNVKFLGVRFSTLIHWYVKTQCRILICTLW